MKITGAYCVHGQRTTFCQTWIVLTTTANLVYGICCMADSVGNITESAFELLCLFWCESTFASITVYSIKFVV